MPFISWFSFHFYVCSSVIFKLSRVHRQDRGPKGFHKSRAPSKNISSLRTLHMSIIIPSNITIKYHICSSILLLVYFWRRWPKAVRWVCRNVPGLNRKLDETNRISLTFSTTTYIKNKLINTLQVKDSSST